MFDPISLWMQSSVFWMKLFKQHQEAYLRALGAFAQNLPHEDSAELAREAEALKEALTVTPPRTRKTVARKDSAGRAASGKSRAAHAELVTA